jgi:hypothetical protein
VSALAVPHTYRYLSGSQFDPSSHALRLATCADSADQHPYFFRGDLVRPKRTAELLRGLMRVVQARYHVPAAMLERILAAADPIVTCSDDRLRFEGFSGCCGVYARVDLLPGAVRGERLGRGTTNVDFNPPMLSALVMIRESDRVSLAIGAVTELPFDLSQVEKLQPRLQNARKLFAENKVRIDSRCSDRIEAFVAGSGVEHRVRLTADDAKCTCPWYSKHAASRGPCKHILAARMAVEAEAGE